MDSDSDYSVIRSPDSTIAHWPIPAIPFLYIL